ncbi:hypothetical protein [Roseivirga sp. UBA838]|uniref:hypothetical protein n=1 Tax=Roseivirga sp. UBA838 TaxID=1947393 RepID=UPI002580D6E6|nr:hypothetical protein [Roseivirga sp. UBA838]|tara:strand:- start:3318 stop:4586 length:1269 start_codon:yes stop_codon:yes gene_type:complete
MKRLFYFFLISCLTALPALAQESLQEVYNAAVAAFEAKDYHTYLEKIREANEMRPNHPTIVAKLAGAWALTGRKSRAVQTLQQMLLMDATFDFTSAPEFESLKNYRGYDDLLELQARLSKVEVHDEVFRVINAGMLHPESFVLLDSGELLLGSIREKRIVKVDTNGLVSDWIDLPYSVLGMKYDALRDHLWVATAAFPEMVDFNPKDQGKSMIVQVDVSEGRILHGVEFNDGSVIGDVLLDDRQRIWHSNSAKPFLVRNVTDTAEYYGAFSRKYIDLQDSHFNLQGLTLNDSQRYLYFADYISGIHRVDLQTDKIEKVFASENILLKGIDGLYFYNNTLLAIHNGVKPYKVVQYFLDESGLFIDMERIINRGGESLGEPTLGQVKDGYFYYLANSPWAAYDANKNLLPEKVSPIEIRRIKLD